MNIIDKIALNRLIQTLANFILALCKIFAKTNINNNVDPSPLNSPSPRPIKKIIDNIMPWRKNK